MSRALISVRSLLLAASFAFSPGMALSMAAPVASATASATATLKDAAGKEVGSARLVQQEDGIALTVSAKGLTPGAHGTHVHMTGTCEALDFKSAGGHWNPTDAHHGLENPQGHHAGDLPNMTVQPDGTGELSFSIAGARLSGDGNVLLDADGAAIVIHAGPDDMKSDPAGNSGGRVACGVIEAG